MNTRVDSRIQLFCRSAHKTKIKNGSVKGGLQTESDQRERLVSDLAFVLDCPDSFDTSAFDLDLAFDFGFYGRATFGAPPY